jgi:methylmalonyl-CoA mutase
MNFFMEIAKLRAARTLWAQIMADFGASPRSQMLRTHCQTSGVSLQEQDPYNNVIRTTVEAMAAALGGTQSLHTNALDEAIALPTDFSARIARNTQLVLQEETGITRVVDPLGGSYYVEALTDSLVKGAQALIDEVEALGGMTRAVESGMPKLEIEKAAAAKQARVDMGEDVIVGVNKYKPASEEKLDILDVDNVAVRISQIERLEAIRSRRDQNAVDAALAALRAGAAGSENLLALAVDAARVRATLGEISSALEDVFGRHTAVVKMVKGIYADAYKGDPAYIRVAEGVEAFERRKGRLPRVLIVKMGQDGHDRGAKVVGTALADLGFDATVGPLFQTPEEARDLALKLDVDIVAASSLAAGHKTLVPALIDALKGAGRGDIRVIAGGVIPAQDYDFLKAVGTAAIFGPGTNIVESAAELLRLLGHNLPPASEDLAAE